MIEAIPSALHRGDDTLPYVTIDQGIELKVLQIKIREGLWVIRNRFAPGSRVQTHKHTGTVFAFTTGANLNLDAAGKVEQVVDAGLVLQYYLLSCEAAGLPKPDVIVE